MNRSQLVFKAIDIFGYIPQNMTRYKDINRIKDIPFNEHAELGVSGDVYYCEPIMNKSRETGVKMPVILNIHGGGFVMGDKNYRKSYSSFWAERGYFVFNINYRLAPMVQFPEFINDAVDGLNYLKELKKFYTNLDLDRIIIMGDSSGGYLASYLTAVAFDDELTEKLGIHKCELKPACLAPFCGIYDVETLLEKNVLPLQLAEVTAETFLGFDASEGIEKLKDYKYFEYVGPSSFVNEKWCPMFITWAEEDFICTDQGQPMMDKVIEKIGADKVDCFVAKGIQNLHCFHLNLALKIAKDCVDACDKFIKKILDIDPVLEEYLRSEYEKDEEEESLKDKILNELKEIREKIEDESEDSLKEKLLSKVRELKESLDKKKDDQDDEPEQTEQAEQTEEKQEVNV